MKDEKLLNLIKEKREAIMENNTIFLPTYAQGFTDALDWMKSIIEKEGCTKNITCDDCLKEMANQSFNQEVEKKIVNFMADTGVR